jgi:RNA polymerase sigma-70 factor (ECF subfamily)
MMSRQTETRLSLLARIADPADLAAWSEFVEIYEESIYRYSRSRGLQDADAWEVVQRVLLVVHQKIDSWQPMGISGSFRSWLLKVSHRVCLRQMRETRTSRLKSGDSQYDGLIHSLDDANPDGVAESLDWQRWALSWAAGIVRREVAPQSWKAFWLTGVKGVGANDVAKQLGVRVGSVYTAKCRVMMRIRELVLELSKGDS